MIPNEPVEEKHLKSFKTPIEDIEKWTGTRYLQLLQKHKVLVVAYTCTTTYVYVHVHVLNMYIHV